MFLTSVAYDYYKSFVTAFIEVNGQPETIFGKPPMKIVTPVVNSAALFETICWILFSILIMVHLAVGQLAFNTFYVFIPVYALFVVFLIAMVALYAYFSLSMFRFAKSIPWIIAFIFILPIAFINVLILFGMPLGFCVVFNLSVMAGVLEDNRLFIPNLLLGIGLLGAVLKGFVRPTEDEENPYSQNRRTIVDIILYLVFIFLLEVFLFLIATKIDGTIPFTTIPLDLPSWGIVFAPVFIGEIMGMIYFAVKGFFEWKLVFKQKDPNGDGWFRGTCFTTMIIFILLLIVGQILIILRMDLGESIFPVPIYVTLIPLPLGLLLILVMFMLPFFDYSIRKMKKKHEKLEARRKEKKEEGEGKEEEEEKDGTAEEGDVPLQEMNTEGVKKEEEDGDDNKGADEGGDIEAPYEENVIKPIPRHRVMMLCFL